MFMIPILLLLPSKLSLLRWYRSGVRERCQLFRTDIHKNAGLINTPHPIERDDRIFRQRSPRPNDNLADATMPRIEPDVIDRARDSFAGEHGRPAADALPDRLFFWPRLDSKRVAAGRDTAVAARCGSPAEVEQHIGACVGVRWLPEGIGRHKVVRVEVRIANGIGAADHQQDPADCYIAYDLDWDDNPPFFRRHVARPCARASALGAREARADDERGGAPVARADNHPLDTAEECILRVHILSDPRLHHALLRRID